MKIGIIGAGMIGGTLGRLWHDAGHEVHLATRHPAKLKKLIVDIGPRAKAQRANDDGREPRMPGTAVYATNMRASQVASTLGELQ